MEQNTFKQGMIFALAAYFMWGLAPLYFKALDGVNSDEILMHRIIWSFVVVSIIIAASGKLDKVKAIISQPKSIIILLSTSVIIAANWLIFIWAIAQEKLLEASLGYYINPILNVLLGVVFLGERLSRLQLVAVMIAVLAVSIPLLMYGAIPWVSIALASTFGAYGLLRKKVNVDSSSGLFIETCLLLPFAIVYWITLDGSSSSNLMKNHWDLNLLLLSAGIVTTLPLLAFAAAAVRIPLFILGFFQYVGPSLMLLLAVFVFGEPFKEEQGITFALLWLALGVFSFDIYKKRIRS
ncbi:EamA family transporter RarD [Paraferrimonas sp. SM1919]|uniref:EamA family transporter RarD n=1 Tax=Paraferrimonas sp. SM1919 TaxID=2662263 RepID=UPI0013D4E6C5|nr:EamA family transporter RarD [Paraferrimonas sp. SM1919]